MWTMSSKKVNGLRSDNNWFWLLTGNENNVLLLNEQQQHTYTPGFSGNPDFPMAQKTYGG